MLIGIDGNEANTENRVGIGEYAFQVLTHLKTQNLPAGRQGSKRKTQNAFWIYLKEGPRSDLPGETSWWKYRVFGPKFAWTQWRLPFQLYWERPRVDVFFSPNHYAPRFCPAPSVIAIMDLWHHYHPEMFRAKDIYQLKKWEAYSVKKAARILTISEATRNDIIKYYRVARKKIVVTYPGYEREKFDTKILRYKDIERLKAKYKIGGDFILYLGTLQPRKNLVRLIEAFTKLKAQGSRLKLVIAGKKGWLYQEILGKAKDLGVKDQVMFTGFVPEEEKPLFYQAAQVFVLPSLYEGFGIPVLEAMAWGCPVVVSNLSSLPEVGGKAAVYIDPYDVNDITRGILEVLRDDEMMHHSRIEGGLRQAKKFSWEKCAKKTLEVLEETARVNV